MSSPTTKVEDLANMASESSVIETQRAHLNGDERQLLKELLRPGASIEAVIPKDATAEELWQTLDACSRGLQLMDLRTRRVGFIVGKILLLFENRPSLYKDLGYDTFTDFMYKGVYDTLGLHATGAWDAKRAAREWPQLDADRYAKIGPKKLNVLSKFANGRSANAELLLETAERMKVPELKAYVEQRGFLEPGEATGASFGMTTNRARLSLFNEFFDDGRVHSVVGSRMRDQILEAMIQECRGEWIARYEEARRAAATRTDV